LATSKVKSAPRQEQAPEFAKKLFFAALGALDMLVENLPRLAEDLVRHGNSARRDRADKTSTIQKRVLESPDVSRKRVKAAVNKATKALKLKPGN
jgi:hypothetical protein